MGMNETMVVIDTVVTVAVFVFVNLYQLIVLVIQFNAIQTNVITISPCSVQTKSITKTFW